MYPHKPSRLRCCVQDPMHFAAIGSRAIERIAHNVSAVSEASGLL